MTNKYDNFTDIPFITNNLDRYFIRTSIFNFIKKSLTYFKGSLLDVGCGQMPYRKYIFENSQIETYTGLDIDTAIEYNKDIRPIIHGMEKLYHSVMKAMIPSLQLKCWNIVLILPKFFRK